MKAQIPWLRVFVEGVVIVGSILMALTADAWWDGQQERGREEALLAGLLDDFQANRPLLLGRIQLVERLVRNGGTLRDLVASSAGDAALPIPATLIRSAIGSPGFQGSTNTLDAALASGEIGLIRSAEIRAELTQWRTTLGYVSATQEDIRQITDQQIVPLLARDVALGPYLDDEIGTEQPATIQPSLELSGALALRHSHQTRTVRGMSNLLDALDRLITLLETELAT